MLGVSPAVEYRRGTTDRTPKNISTEKCQPMYEHSTVASTDEFYIKTRESVKKKGFKNPLLVLQEGEIFLVKMGCTRLAIAKELNIKEVPVIILKHEDDWEWFHKDYNED